MPAGKQAGAALLHALRAECQALACVCLASPNGKEKSDHKLPALGAGAGRGPGAPVQHAGGQRLQRRLQRLPLRLRRRRAPRHARGLHGQGTQLGLPCNLPSMQFEDVRHAPAPSSRAPRMQRRCMAGQEAGTPAAPHTPRTLRGHRAVAEQHSDAPCIRSPAWPFQGRPLLRGAREAGAARRGAPARRQQLRADARGQHRAADGDDPGRRGVPAPAGGRARARARCQQRAPRGRPRGRHGGALMTDLRCGRAAAGRAGVAPRLGGADPAHG